jgi:ABC-type uncharacterized transport system substrate-binding protein
MRMLRLPLLILASMAALTGPVQAGDVAVIMSARVDAYDEALRGFKRSLRHRIVAEYDMSGDFGRGREIASEIKSKVKPDLIFAVGIWALQVLIGETAKIPVVYAMVLNPPSIIGASSKNVTGASMNVPVDQIIHLFKQLGPQIQRLGVVFDQAKTGYLLSAAESIAREQGLQLITREIHSPREAIPALDSLQGEGIDALWILPDDTILAPEVVQYMLLFSYRNKVPLLGLSERHAQMGALLSLSFASSEDIGQQAGELANSILAGKTAAEVPYTTARLVKLIVNLKAAQKLGIEIPKSLIAMADNLIQ